MALITILFLVDRGNVCAEYSRFIFWVLHVVSCYMDAAATLDTQ